MRRRVYPEIGVHSLPHAQQKSQPVRPPRPVLVLREHGPRVAAPALAAPRGQQHHQTGPGAEDAGPEPEGLEARQETGEEAGYGSAGGLHGEEDERRLPAGGDEVGVGEGGEGHDDLG